MLIVIDPALSPSTNHHYSVFMRIAGAMAERGIPVVGLGHTSCEHGPLPEGVRIMRAFPFTPYDCSSSRPEMANKAREFFGAQAMRYTAKVASLLQGLKVGPNDVILIPTANAPDFCLAANLVEHNFGLNPKAIHLVTPYDQATMFLTELAPPLKNSVTRLKNRKALRTKVFLHAENSPLATKLKSDLGIDISTMLFPFPGERQPLVSSGSRLRVALFGAARIEKGIKHINNFVDALAESGDADRSFDITVHCAPPARGYEPGVEEIVYELASRDYGFLTVSREVLSPEAYDAAMQATDAVFLPYEAARYAFRSSNVAIEAAVAGKLIIATADTFPATISSSPGLLTGKTPREFVNAFWRAYAMRDQLLESAATMKRINPLTPAQFQNQLWRLAA